MKVILSGFVGAVIGGIIVAVIILNLQSGNNYPHLASSLGSPVGKRVSAPESEAPDSSPSPTSSPMPGFGSAGGGEGQAYRGKGYAGSGISGRSGEGGSGGDTGVRLSGADTVGGIGGGQPGGRGSGKLINFLPIEFKREIAMFGYVFPIGHAIVIVLIFLLVISSFSLVLAARLRR